MGKRAYIVVDHTIPTGHPNGLRVANIGLILKELGYQVVLIGFEVGKTTTTFYKGMECVLLGERGGNGFFNALKRDSEKLKSFKAFLESREKPDVVISGLFNDNNQRYLMQYCAKNKVKIIETVCEWFDRSNFKGIKGALKFINNRYSLMVQYRQIGNVLAISNLLDDYYARRGCNTATIPTIVDLEEYTQVVNAPKSYDVPIKIAYAGSPARKDYIANAIWALALLTEDERKQLQLDFYGPTQEQLSVLGIPEEFWKQYCQGVVCHGRIPYEQVKTKIAQADFTVLLRPQKRYANAGFPTKVGESMACGTPVIANLTSDLHKYIIDGKTGIVCADETPEACAEAFRKVLALTQETRMQMHENCLEMARQAFDYRAYVDAMNDFLKNIIK